MISEELLQIFYSGFDAGPNWMILDDLETLINEGAILVTKEKIATVEEYKRYLDEVSISDGLGPQSKGHMALKVLGGKFLKKSGFLPKFEFYFRGLHPDVIDSTYKVIIECGTTDPSGILNFFGDERVSWVGVIPYPSENEKELYLYKFIRSKSFADYLEFRTRKLRQVFRKARG